MDRPFSIQKLPFVALKHLIEYLTPYDIYILCTISRRIRNLIRSVIPRNKYKLKVNISFNIETIYECKGCPSYFPYEFRIRNRNLFDETIAGYHIYSSTTEYGFNAMRAGVEMLCFVLKCEIDVLYIESEYCNWLIPSITDWLSSIQSTINECEFIGSTSYSPQLLYLIQNLKVNKKFSIKTNGAVPNGSQFNPKFDMDTLHFTEKHHWCSWLTIDNIISSNCIILILGGEVNISSEGMNKFLKSWIQGSNSRLRYLEIYPICSHYPTLIEGIQVHEQDKSLKRLFEHPDLEYNAFDFKGGADIVNVNGKKATFQIERDEMEDPVDWIHGYFQFAVWDD